jgi:hypothetical protein
MLSRKKIFSGKSDFFPEKSDLFPKNLILSQLVMEFCCKLKTFGEEKRRRRRGKKIGEGKKIGGEGEKGKEVESERVKKG